MWLSLLPVEAVAQKGGKPPAGGTKPGGLVTLPPQRADRVKELMGRVKLANAQLEKRLQAQREELEECYRTYRFDERHCRRLHQALRQTQDQLLELHHQFQIELRSLLTEAEYEMLQQEFRKAREEKLKFLNGQKKRGGKPVWKE